MIHKHLWITLCFVVSLVAACMKAPELTLLSVDNLELSADGSSGSFEFTANRDWIISCPDAWITVSPSSGQASDSPVAIQVNAYANTTYEDRNAVITIRMGELSRTVSVCQPANLAIIASTQSFVLTSDARTIDVEVRANVQYSVSTDVNWIRQAGTKALFSTRYTFSITENQTYDNREGRIILKPQNSGVAEQVISVKQAQRDAIIVKDTSFDMPYGGGEIAVRVDANVSFDVESNANWIQYVSTKGLNSSTVTLRVKENETSSTREGRVTISQNNGNLKYDITVNQACWVAVSSVELNRSELVLQPSETTSLVATVKPVNASDKTVSWTSSNPAVVAVNDTGVLSAQKEGTAIITANASGKTATCAVTVCIPVSSVTINKTELELFEGETESLVATVLPNNATDKKVSWSSSDTAIATVDDSGLVTAVGEGSATITAKVGDKDSTCHVVIKHSPIFIREDDHGHLLREGESVTLAITVEPAEARSRLIWVSTNPELVSVDKTGKVTAIKYKRGCRTAYVDARIGNAFCRWEVSVERAVPKGAIDIGLRIVRNDNTMYHLFFAECNLGASSLEGFGSYYSWGETETKDSYWKWNYKLGDYDGNKKDYLIHKYCRSPYIWNGPGEPDGKTILDPEDDVAHVILGGDWRMPTVEEWEELIRYTSNSHLTWTEKGGVRGYEVEFASPSYYNCKTLFLPAAGHNIEDKTIEKNSTVYLWCSELASDDRCAKVVHVYMKNKSPHIEISNVPRSYGLPVRPVLPVEDD